MALQFERTSVKPAHFSKNFKLAINSTRVWVKVEITTEN